MTVGAIGYLVGIRAEDGGTSTLLWIKKKWRLTIYCIFSDRILKNENKFEIKNARKNKKKLISQGLNVTSR